VVLVTLHPSTLGGDPRAEADALVAAMDDVAATYVITLPNVDPGQRVIRERLEAAGRLPRRVAVPALGEQRYWAMLRSADAMLGNSSSGLIEAPAAHLPAVNIGERQKGRLRGANVIDVAAEPGEIAAGLQQALSPCFREQCRRAPSPFGDGHSGAEIVEILGRWTPPDPPVKKGVWC
jgi:UDP-N-acetylglucosamine 2-epimerase